RVPAHQSTRAPVKVGAGALFLGKVMFNDKIIRIAFLVSLLGHLLFLGIPGFNLDDPPVQKPEDISIVMRMEIPQFLPEPEPLPKPKPEPEPKPKPEPEPKPKPEPEPEPEPEPKPKPEPKPEPEAIVMEEPLAEPEPAVEPAVEPKLEPQEIVMDAPLREPPKEQVEVIDLQEVMLCYQAMIRQRIETHRRYPRWAKRQGFEGTAYLSFTILASGQAENIRIVFPSGFTILDNEAVSTINRASPFPPIPKELNRSQLDIKVAIVFRLD
ncbi:TonB family protein, partial [Thermodesulfovibrionales bacterium]|nr:TonB family protein [Thermodesulfovibrionales bacterium]